MLKKLLGLIFSVCLPPRCSATPDISSASTSKATALTSISRVWSKQSAAILSLLPKTPATSSTPVTTVPPPPGAVQQQFPPTTQVRQQACLRRRFPSASKRFARRITGRTISVTARALSKVPTVPGSFRWTPAG